MALERTLTTKQRRVEVYLPTLEARDRWSEEASRRRMSLSQMVFELVKAALAGGRTGDAPGHDLPGGDLHGLPLAHDFRAGGSSDPSRS